MSAMTAAAPWTLMVTVPSAAIGTSPAMEVEALLVSKLRLVSALGAAPVA
ncbi:hypothetical protein GXW82_10350 [Streptacidiphilus sp. 4-A2]|nr:hypothetical protein [Streptacidiphilus sp. 4-A2]